MIVGGQPRLQGTLRRQDRRIAFQVFGDGAPAILLLPTWSIVHSDFWRHQVPHLASSHTVVVFDGVGNGGSSRPTDPGSYSDYLFADDALAVLDAVGVQQAVSLSVSVGARWNLLLAARHPERITAAAFIAASVPFGPTLATRTEAIEKFDDVLGANEGWLKFNRHYWSQDWLDFLRFFFGQCFTEEGSESQIEHFVQMGLQTTPGVVAATVDAPALAGPEAIALAESVRVPVLVVHGDADSVSDVGKGRELARLTRAEYVERPGEGHEPQCRHPESTNAIIDDFLARAWAARSADPSVPRLSGPPCASSA